MAVTQVITFHMNKMVKGIAALEKAGYNHNGVKRQDGVQYIIPVGGITKQLRAAINNPDDLGAFCLLPAISTSSDHQSDTVGGWRRCQAQTHASAPFQSIVIQRYFGRSLPMQNKHHNSLWCFCIDKFTNIRYLPVSTVEDGAMGTAPWIGRIVGKYGS